MKRLCILLAVCIVFGASALSLAASSPYVVDWSEASGVSSNGLNVTDQPESDALQGFWFGIYKDVPKDDPDDSPDSSHPAGLSREDSDDSGALDLNEWFYTNFVNWQGQTEYKYAYSKDLDPEDWFSQDPSKDVEWLAGATIMQGGAVSTWGGKSSGEQSTSPRDGESTDQASASAPIAPIPTAALLLGSGLIGLVVVRRRVNKAEVALSCSSGFQFRK